MIDLAIPLAGKIPAAGGYWTLPTPKEDWFGVIGKLSNETLASSFGDLNVSLLLVIAQATLLKAANPHG